MMEQHLNAARREAERVLARRAAMRIGIVTSYDPDNYAAKVEIQPEGVETGWLPIGTAWSGNGWGDYGPPSPGDVVEVNFQEGGKLAGSIGNRHYGDEFRPLPVSAGERWIVHKSGASFKLTNDGKVTVTDKAGSSFILNGDGTTILNSNLLVNGDILATGDITDLNDGKGSLASFRAAYDAHRHGGVQAGGDSTGTTDHPV